MGNDKKKDLQQWFRKKILQNAPGTKLPTTHDIARKWHMTERTVSDIMKPFLKEGALIRRPGLGTIIGPEDQLPDKRISQSLPPARKIADIISEHIHNGTLKQSDMLPSINYMSRTYHASTTTISKAYRILIREGLVSKIGARFFVQSSKRLITMIPGNRIIWIVLPNNVNPKQIYSDDSWNETYQYLEKEMRRYSYDICFTKTNDIEKLFKNRIITQNLPCALLLWRADMMNLTKLLPQLRQIAKRQHPHRFPIIFDSNPSTYIYSTKDSLTVSRLRIERYSTRVLLEICAQKRYKKALCVSNKGIHWPIFEVFCTDARRFAPFIKMQTLMLSENIDGPGVCSVFFDKIPAYARDLFTSQNYEELMNLENVTASTPKGLENTIKMYKPNVILCNTIEIAADILVWAQKKGYKVPQDFAIIGLGDNPTLTHMAISTVSYDKSRLGYIMAHAIIGDIRTNKSPRGFLRFPGNFIERNTT